MRDPEPADRGFPNPPSGASNALAAEPSAYLRQHAGNPVHWQPFGDAAFATAAARDVPVFLSIGYAACHWCHVMAHESFEDQDTADYLNAHFVSIKVDREERPDVDAVYMTATQAISGEGGWPMSVFLLPDGRAFHAGTYYPPRPMPGRPSFRQVLEAVNEAWTERRGAVEANADTLARGIAASQPAAVLHLDGPPEALDAALLGEAVAALSGAEDRAHGGFGGAPKFPPAAVLEFLIRHAAMPPAGAPDTASPDAVSPDAVSLDTATLDRHTGTYESVFNGKAIRTRIWRDGTRLLAQTEGQEPGELRPLSSTVFFDATEPQEGGPENVFVAGPDGRTVEWIYRDGAVEVRSRRVPERKP